MQSMRQGMGSGGCSFASMQRSSMRIHLLSACLLDTASPPSMSEWPACLSMVTI